MREAAGGADRRWVDRERARRRRHDATAIAGYLKAPIADRGLWFADPACAAQFAGSTTIEADRIAAFAACVATLPLEHVVHEGKTYLVYAPGIEVAVTYALEGEHAFVTGIGHAVVPGAPDAAHLRIQSLHDQGEHTVPPDDVDKIQVSMMSVPRLQGSFEVCFDPTGAIQSVAILESTRLPSYDRKIIARIKTWTFQPVLVGARALDVCTAVTFIYAQRI